MLIWCRLIIWFHDHLPFMIIYCLTVSLTWRMLKLCENGSNIDYLYETNSVLRKPQKPKFRVWPFGFGSGFKNRNRTEIRFLHIPNNCLCCRLADKKAAIGYTYEDSGAGAGGVSALDDDDSSDEDIDLGLSLVTRRLSFSLSCAQLTFLSCLLVSRVELS